MNHVNGKEEEAMEISRDGKNPFSLLALTVMKLSLFFRSNISKHLVKHCLALICIISKAVATVTET